MLRPAAGTLDSIKSSSCDVIVSLWLWNTFRVPTNLAKNEILADCQNVVLQGGTRRSLPSVTRRRLQVWATECSDRKWLPKIISNFLWSLTFLVFSSFIPLFLLFLPHSLFPPALFPSSTLNETPVLPHPSHSDTSPPTEETVTLSDASPPPAEAPADSALSEVSGVALETDHEAPAAAAAAPATDDGAADAPLQCNRTSQIRSAVAMFILSSLREGRSRLRSSAGALVFEDTVDRSDWELRHSNLPLSPCVQVPLTLELPPSQLTTSASLSQQRRKPPSPTRLTLHLQTRSRPLQVGSQFSLYFSEEKDID